MLFHSYLSEVDREGTRIKNITVVNKSGHRNFSAQYFIDSTGDADLSYLAGCEYKVGRDEDNLLKLILHIEYFLYVPALEKARGLQQPWP